MKLRIGNTEVIGDLKQKILRSFGLEEPIRVFLDGKFHTFDNMIMSQEAIQDAAFRQSLLDTIRTPDATEDEIKGWEHMSRMLEKFNFEESRKKVTFLEWDDDRLCDVPYDPNERRRNNYNAYAEFQFFYNS